MTSKIYIWLSAGFIIGFISYHLTRGIERFKPAYKYFKYVMVVRTDVDVGKAETAEMCSQVTLQSYRLATEFSPEFLKKWERNSQPKIVVKLDKDYENEAMILKAKAEHLGLPAVALKKKGRLTVLGIGPGPEELINEVTGHLKLLG